MPPHVDPDDLALLALGERPDGVETSHLDGCAQCRRELDELRALVTASRSSTPEDAPVAPPGAVWEAVTRELGLEVGAPGLAAARHPGRRRTLVLAAAAGLVGAVLGAGATALLTADDEEGQVVASTRLEALPDHAGAGDAEVVGTGGSRVLEVDVSGLTRGDGFYEVWLLGPDATRLVSVGLLDTLQGTRASFPLPADLDVADFPVVDISLEPADGNPEHSGDSVVRGTLTG